MACAVFTAVPLFAATAGPVRGQTNARDTTIAELPRITLDTRYTPAAQRVIRVGRGDNLQRAIDRAMRGDVLLLEAGAEFSAIVLKAKPGDGWIVIRTDTPDSLLEPGRRAAPRDARLMARIVTERPQTAAISTQPGADHYQLIGLEVTAAPAISQLFALVKFGDGSDVQRSLDGVPSDLILDRSWVHGHDRLQLQRCVLLNSARTSVIDSYLSACHAKGYDSQAILGYNGPGPYKIENNYLEGAGENVMFGGADPGIANLVPSDIEIRRNHFNKPLAWKGRWTVKNLLEFKNARRVLVEGNVFENNWVDGQAGFALAWKSVNQEGRAPWSQTSDVTFRWNIVRNTPAGLSLAAHPEQHPAVPAARFLVEHNLFVNIGAFHGTRSGRLLMLHGPLRDVVIRHNTMLHNVAEGHALLLEGRGAGNIVLRANILTKGGEYGPMSGAARQGTAAFTAYASPWSFSRNVIVGANPSFRSWFPPDTRWAQAIEQVGFVDVKQGSYALSARSPYRGSAAGWDPGPDIGRLRAATKGVVVQ